MDLKNSDLSDFPQNMLITCVYFPYEAHEGTVFQHNRADCLKYRQSFAGTIKLNKSDIYNHTSFSFPGKKIKRAILLKVAYSYPQFQTCSVDKSNKYPLF